MVPYLWAHRLPGVVKGVNGMGVERGGLWAIFNISKSWTGILYLPGYGLQSHQDAPFLCFWPCGYTGDHLLHTREKLCCAGQSGDESPGLWQQIDPRAARARLLPRRTPLTELLDPSEPQCHRLWNKDNNDAHLMGCWGWSTASPRWKTAVVAGSYD